MVERYFDAFLYLANWGTRRLMFRLPRGVLDAEAAGLCCHRREVDGMVRAWLAEPPRSGHLRLPSRERDRGIR